MKGFFALFFLGILQGLTEFLPVSSSGHLVLFSKIFGVEESLLLSILLHVATLLSILVVFHKDVWQMIRHPFSKQTLTLAVATIPTCVIVLILMPIVKLSFSGLFLPASFLICAVLLYVGQKCQKQAQDGQVDTAGGQINFKTAFLMGVAQGFAVFPGISRSGTTISAGMLAGKNKKEVAKFSFLMSIPIIVLSLLMEIFEIVTTKTPISLEVVPTIFSFLAAFLVGIFAIKVMISLTAKANFKWFCLYLVCISVFSLFFV